MSISKHLLNAEGEVVVQLASGWTLRSGVYNKNEPDALTSGEYVRLCRPDGEVETYWDQAEWRAEPALVMGAILNSAAGLRSERIDEISAAAPAAPVVQPSAGPLNEAIEALKLASECGGELDLEIYQAAHTGLIAMRDEIRAHDARLDDRQEPPTGDDYNQVLSILHLA